jgi:hypothetical protein
MIKAAAVNMVAPVFSFRFEIISFQAMLAKLLHVI